jgi:hypothetical protein
MEEPEASPREEGGVAVTGAHGGAAVPDDDPPECAVWAMGVPADAVGPSSIGESRASGEAGRRRPGPKGPRNAPWRSRPAGATGRSDASSGSAVTGQTISGRRWPPATSA